MSICLHEGVSFRRDSLVLYTWMDGCLYPQAFLLLALKQKHVFISVKKLKTGGYLFF